MSADNKVNKRAIASENLQARLRDLNTDLYERNNEYKTARKTLSQTRNNALKLKEEIAKLKEEYKDQRYLAVCEANDAYKKSRVVCRIKDQIRLIEMEVALVASDTAQKEEKKANTKAIKKLKKGEFSDELLQKVNKLPEEIVALIGSFLPADTLFSIKVRELEYRIKTQNLISRCSAPLRSAFLTSFSSTRQFLDLLPYEDAVKEVKLGGTRYHYCSCTKDTQLKIHRLIEMAKASNPEFAYDMLKKLHILIDPAKKYKCPKRRWNFDPFNHNILTMEDVLANRTAPV